MADLLLVLALLLLLVIGSVLLATVVVSPIIALGMAVEARRPLGGKRIMTGGLLLIPVLVFLAFVSLTGAGYSVSPAEAEAELERVLAVEVPPIVTVSDEWESWSPGDLYYGYSAHFGAEEFERLSADWSSGRDSVVWVRIETPRAETWRRDDPNAPGGAATVEVTFVSDQNVVVLQHLQD